MPASTLVNVLDALVTGLATVAGLSTAAVSKYDYRVMNLPYSVVVAPELSGTQTLETADNGYVVVHRVKVLLTITQRGDVTDLLTSTATMLPLVLAWFRGAGNLGLDDCLGAGTWEPLTWTSPDRITSDNGVLSKEVSFVVSVALSV